MATAERLPECPPHVVLRIRSPREEIYDEEFAFGAKEKATVDNFQFARTILKMSGLLGLIAAFLFFVAFYTFGGSYFFMGGIVFMLLSITFLGIVEDSKP